MARVIELLQQLAPRIEAQLKPNLRGLTGFLVRGYLPQVWLFDTGKEQVSLQVNSSGDVRISTGSVGSVDVLITTSHDVLYSALEAAMGLRSRESVIAGPVKPEFRTPKGRTAFNFLRRRLGL